MQCSRLQGSRAQQPRVQRRQICCLRPLQDSMMQHLQVQDSRAQRQQQPRVQHRQICLLQSKRLAWLQDSSVQCSQLQDSRAQGLQALQALRMQHSKQYRMLWICWQLCSKQWMLSHRRAQDSRAMNSRAQGSRMRRCPWRLTANTSSSSSGAAQLRAQGRWLMKTRGQPCMALRLLLLLPLLWALTASCSSRVMGVAAAALLSSCRLHC
jgi:hypothetical protein